MTTIRERSIEYQARHTTVLLYFSRFVFQLSTRFRHFSTAFQIFKSFEYLSRSNMAKC